MATKAANKAQPESTAVAVQSAFAMTDGAVPDYIKQGQQRGSENVGRDDLAIPRLEIVQSESPIKEDNPEAEDGMLFNSATGDLLGDTVYFVPVFFQVEHLVWVIKDAGGGFFGSFPSATEAHSRKVEVMADEKKDDEEVEVVDTPVHYGLLVFPDGRASQQIVISMPKSKAKVSRKWNSMIQIVGGDRFSRVYRISTFKDKNKQGKTFQNFVIQPAGFPPEHIYREAEKTYEAFNAAGAPKADHAGKYSEAGGNDGATTDRGDV